MERLIKLSKRKIREVKTGFKRFLYSEIDWNQPLILMKGHRGAGKTTLLLQRAKEISHKKQYTSASMIFTLRHTAW